MIHSQYFQGKLLTIHRLLCCFYTVYLDKMPESGWDVYEVELGEITKDKTLLIESRFIF